MSEIRLLEILIVDDDAGDALMTQEALEDSDCPNNFHVVHDGVDALAFMKKEGEYSDVPTPDIVFLDINMPRMNGHEVLSWMRRHETYKTVPVVIFTTSNSDEDILKSYQNHANCFITKPTDLESFNKVVKTINEFWTNIVQLPRN